MKRLLCILFASPIALLAQLEIIPVSELRAVFAGDRAISVTFHNPTAKPASINVQTQLWQVSSATEMLAGEFGPWKRLEVLAGQTILETVAVTLPLVRAETLFQLRFCDAENKEIDRVSIHVFPDNLLKQLALLVDQDGLGVLDPDNVLKPLLRRSKVAFKDIEEGGGFSEFDGKLAIVGPFRPKDSMPENLRKRIDARTIGSIVWIQPSNPSADPLLPLYLVRQGEATVAIVQNHIVSNLATSPRAQLNLIRCARLALSPELLGLPDGKQLPGADRRRHEE